MSANRDSADVGADIDAPTAPTAVRPQAQSPPGPAGRHAMGALEAIHTRRSHGRLVEPAPHGAELEALLAAAAAAPDHGRLRPWRFYTLAGDTKDAFGQVLADAYRRRCEFEGVEPDETKLTKERTKLGRAPLVVVAGCVPVEGPIPEIEQLLATAAAVQNLLIAAIALGYGSMWRTGEPAYDPTVKEALGLAPEDTIVGFIYLGTPLGTTPR